MPTVLDQSSFETVIIPKLKQAKDEAKGLDQNKVNLYALLRSLDFEPKFQHINFSIPDVTVNSQKIPTADLKLFTPTDVLTNIDYSGCEFEDCNFDWCNLSDSTFDSQNFTRCRLQRTVMQSIVAHNVGFYECEMERSSFDFSEFDDIEFQRSKLAQVSCGFLRTFQQVVFDDCPMDGISFLGAKKSEHCKIQFTERSVLNDVYLFGNEIELIRAEIGVCRHPVGLSWNASKPSPTIELARTAILDQKLYPILVEYQPPIVNITQLKEEVKQAVQDVESRKVAERKKCDEEKKIERREVKLQQEPKRLKDSTPRSLPFLILETAKSSPETFSNIMSLYRYIESNLKQLHGYVIPGGADIHPIFYGQPLDPKTIPHTDDRRDIIDFAIVHAQQYIGLPIYGICRGSQIIALSFGSDFYQHIGEEHKFKAEAPILEEIEKKRASCSEMATLIKAAQADKQASPVTFWLHHQAYQLSPKVTSAECPAPFDVLATCKLKSQDLVITVAAESLDRNITFVQYHPEGGKDKSASKALNISVMYADSFLNNFHTRVQAYVWHKQQVNMIKRYQSMFSSKSPAKAMDAPDVALLQSRV